MVGTASRRIKKKSSPYKITYQALSPHRTILTHSQSSSMPSFFERLPPELFHMILGKLSMVELSVFSMVSKGISAYVAKFISTMSWRNKIIIQSFHHSACPDEQSIALGHYRDLGLLFKRCTLLLPTKERLKLIFSNFSQVPCFMLGQCMSPDCFGFSSLGVFVQTLIAGWDELECQRVFSFLCKLTNLMQKVEAVITEPPGVKRNQELQVRLFCRRVLLDPWKSCQEGHFWLTQLLKLWPLVSQAQLLFILYGPQLHDGTLGWQQLVARGQPEEALCELAEAIVLLFSKLDVKGWTADSMVAVLEELTVLPWQWHVENVARLLVMCGSNFCYTILVSKAINGRLTEISTLIVYITLVCEKDGYSMNWVVHLVQKICQIFSTADEKLNFIKHLENMFSEVIRGFYELLIARNHGDDRETFHNLCVLLSSVAHFHTKILHTLLKSN
ncbi:F-box only protein 47-like [Thalassophryne amazonica]|uniref:F-box only protein 47-like n=1 Tax=Thalassophryne amazonica TaxID=390379 RepID=UPI001470C220|nr:F-box only protein 47-like [Thalassophryne amazonica]